MHLWDTKRGSEFTKARIDSKGYNSKPNIFVKIDSDFYGSSVVLGGALIDPKKSSLGDVGPNAEKYFLKMKDREVLLKLYDMRCMHRTFSPAIAEKKLQTKAQKYQTAINGLSKVLNMETNTVNFLVNLQKPRIASRIISGARGLTSRITSGKSNSRETPVPVSDTILRTRAVPIPKFLGYISYEADDLFGQRSIVKGLLFFKEPEPREGMHGKAMDLSDALDDEDFLPKADKLLVMDEVIKSGIAVLKLGVEHRDIMSLTNTLVLKYTKKEDIEAIEAQPESEGCLTGGSFI